MALASRKEFIACVTKSTVIPDDQLKQWLEVVEDTDPMKIASKMVRDKLLTPWQAKFLISGRSRLNVGNYILQTRTSSDELGDKFEAFHASLNRKVVIQFFPSKISQDKELLEKLLKKLRQITELDHPNLVHVYDVDQESERYFLITEFVEGDFLEAVSPADLDDSQIAVIVQDIAAGLSHAHQTNILHGNVTSGNIILTPEGEAKLEGFPASTLLSEIDHDPNAPPKVQSKSTDFKQLAKIGLSLLKEMPKAARSDEFETVASLFRQLGTAQTPGPKIEQLNEWVDQNVVRDATPIDDDLDDDFGSPAIGDLGNLGSLQPKKPKQVKQISPNAEQAKPVSNSLLSKMWRKHRPALFAFAAAILLAIGCLVGLLIYALSPAEPEVARQNQPLLGATNTSQTDASDNTAVFDEEANRKKLADFYSKKEKGKEDKKTANKSSDENPKPEKPKPEKPTPPQKNQEEKKPEKPPADVAADNQSNTEDPVIPPEVSPTEVTSTRKSAADEEEEPEPKAVEIGNPFKDMVEQVGLPESGNTEDFTMTDLVIKKNHLLGLDLISGPEISPRKFELTLNRSGDDNQLWDLAIQAKRKEAVNVAQFQKTEEQMIFRWLPAAAENEDANYLRNCKLKLTTPDDTGFLGLREPVAIEGLRFTTDEASVKTELDLPWLPNPAALKIELQPFDTGNNADKISFNPREIAKRLPGRIFFRPNDEQKIFSIDVTADTRKKVKIAAQMTLTLPNSKPQALRKRTELDGLLDIMEAKKTEAFAYNQQVQATPRQPNGMSRDEFTRIKTEANDNAEKINEAFLLTSEYVELNKRLTDVELPVLIYFEMDGQPVVLAETASQK